MSKDRELLIEIMSYIAKGKLKVERLESNEYENIRETKELLAQPQPEQTEQEPVAWMYEEATSFDKDGYLAGWLPCFYLEKADEDKSLRKETPLYTALPKREPLSEAEILNLYQDFSKTTFVELVRQIEKAHGIGVK